MWGFGRDYSFCCAGRVYSCRVVGGGESGCNMSGGKKPKQIQADIMRQKHMKEKIVQRIMLVGQLLDQFDAQNHH